MTVPRQILPQGTAREWRDAPELGSDAARADRGPGVSPEERRRLARCCAYFKAAHFRVAGPDEIREDDIRAVLAEIDAVLERCGTRHTSKY